MSVVDYTTKFEEQVRFCPHYNGVEVKILKWVKIENGLCLEIKQFMGYQKICRCSLLVNKCHIYDEDSQARSAPYKNANEEKNGGQNYGKPYVTLADKGKQKTVGRKDISGGGAPTSLRCFKFEGLDHCISKCKRTILTCFKRRKNSYFA